MDLNPIPDAIPELLRLRAETTPALIACRRRTSPGAWEPTAWGRLWHTVRAAAAALRGLGLAPGDRLAVCAPTCEQWLVAEMAGLLAGAVVVGIDAHAPAEQARSVLAHAGAAGLVVEGPAALERFSDTDRAALKFVVSLSPAAGAVGWPNLLAPRPPFDGPGPAPDEPAALIYTSGTTGTPKGIEYTHRQLMTACRANLETFPPLFPGESAVCWLPMAHLFQRTINLVAVARGVTTHFVEDPRQIMACVAETAPAAFTAVPRFYEKLYEGIREKLDGLSGVKKRLADAALVAGDEWSRCLRDGRTPSWSLRARHAVLDRLVLRTVRRVMGPNLRFLITGSAPTPPWLLEFFHGVGLLILEAYGVSENAIPVAANRADAFRFGSVGRPMPGNEVRLAEDGEVHVRGPALFRGYYREPRDAALFTPDGFYRTGDVGRFDDDGYLYLLGRKSEVIKTSTGRRVSPAAVEAVYRRSPLFDQVVVFGDGRKHLVALVVLKAPADDGQVRRELEEQGRALAPHERVRAFAVLPEPLSMAHGELTTTLKLRRDRVAARHRDRLERLFAEEPAAVETPGR